MAPRDPWSVAVFWWGYFQLADSSWMTDRKTLSPRLHTTCAYPQLFRKHRDSQLLYIRAQSSVEMFVHAPRRGATVTSSLYAAQRSISRCLLASFSPDEFARWRSSRQTKRLKIDVSLLQRRRVNTTCCRVKSASSGDVQFVSRWHRPGEKGSKLSKTREMDRIMIVALRSCRNTFNEYLFYWVFSLLFLSRSRIF